MTRALHAAPLRDPCAIFRRVIFRPWYYVINSLSCSGKTTRRSLPAKLILVVIADKFKRAVKGVRSQLNEGLQLCKSDNILKWHRESVKHKWTNKHGPGAGRLRTAAEVEVLEIRLVREHPQWGADPIHGELMKLDCAAFGKNV